MKLKDSIILIVVVIIAIVLGVFVGIKITESKSSNDKNNGTTTDNNQGENFSLEEARELMDKYSYNACVICGKYYMTDLTVENMAVLAIKNSLADGKFTCDDLKKEGLDKYEFDGSKGFLYNSCEQNVNFYNYDNVSIKYKSLFGASNNLSKFSFNDKTAGIVHYYYSDINNLFIELPLPSGCACDDYNIQSDIKSAEIIDNNLIIVAYNKTDYVDEKYKDIYNEYKYTFKQENGNYYLAEITEVK